MTEGATNPGTGESLTQRLNFLAGVVVDAAMRVHRSIGPGLLESAYRVVLAHELRSRGMRVAEEVPIPIRWEGMLLNPAFRADLIVDDLVIVEVKSVEVVAPVHRKQLLTYLRVADKRLGLLVNFGAELLKDGLHRVVNQLDERPN